MTGVQTCALPILLAILAIDFNLSNCFISLTKTFLILHCNMTGWEGIVIVTMSAVRCLD